MPPRHLAVQDRYRLARRKQRPKGIEGQEQVSLAQGLLQHWHLLSRGFCPIRDGCRCWKHVGADARRIASWLIWKTRRASLFVGDVMRAAASVDESVAVGRAPRTVAQILANRKTSAACSLMPRRAAGLACRTSCIRALHTSSTPPAQETRGTLAEDRTGVPEMQREFEPTPSTRYREPGLHGLESDSPWEAKICTRTPADACSHRSLEPLLASPPLTGLPKVEPPCVEVGLLCP